MTELKPCPFCGGEAVVSSHPVYDKEDVFEPPEEGFCIACECCCASSSSINMCDVIDTWNNRPIEDKLKAKADLFDETVKLIEWVMYKSDKGCSDKNISKAGEMLDLLQIAKELNMKITKEYLKELHDRYEALERELDELGNVCQEYLTALGETDDYIYIDMDCNPITINSDGFGVVRTSCDHIPIKALTSGDHIQYAKDELERIKEAQKQNKINQELQAKEYRKQEYLKLKEEFENEAQE